MIARRASRSVRVAAATLALAMLVATRDASAGEDDGVWDNAPNWVAGTLRFATAVHVTSLPSTLSLCRRRGRSCSGFGEVDSAVLDGPKRVVANSLEIAMEAIAVGPFRFGVEIQLGVGHGPSGSEHGLASSGWGRGAGGLVFGVRMRGRWWAAFADVLPEFVGLSSTLTAPQHERDDVAEASPFMLTTRAGLGLRLTRTTSLFAFGGGGYGFGVANDVTGGLRFAWTPW